MAELFKAPGDNMKIIIRRIYGYLERFKLDGIKIDTFYVISNIVYGDTKQQHQNYLRRVVNNEERES